MKFETQFTRDFIKRSLPAGTRRVLEIGCGSGELAVNLVQDGVSLIAIDKDVDSIAAAQKLGVDARIAAWPDFADGQFDAVLFTRSLHHIHPLDKAVQQAADSLVIGGRLIVEDFAYETADEKTLQWFGDVIERLEGAGFLVKGDDFLGALRSKIELVKRWRENHESDLHTAVNIFAEIRRVSARRSAKKRPIIFVTCLGRLFRAPIATKLCRIWRNRRLDSLPGARFRRSVAASLQNGEINLERGSANRYCWISSLRV
jgi:SAM-dependent methyltransferase